jgi:hypothetical protein
MGLGNKNKDIIFITYALFCLVGIVKENIFAAL